MTPVRSCVAVSATIALMMMVPACSRTASHGNDMATGEANDLSVGSTGDDLSAGGGVPDLSGVPDLAACAADTMNDANNCGACGHVCGGGQRCVTGMCTCPPYQALCNGACISTVADPNNCGACNKTCSGAKPFCSAGVCSASCQPGSLGCNGACIDPNTDNANCGQCNHPCPTGTGCSAGQCVPAFTSPADAGPPPPCPNGGPPVGIDDGNGKKCSGDIAQTAFTWALCTCTDVINEVKLETDAFDSAKGPYTPPDPTMPMSLGAGIGANGAIINGNQNSDLKTWGPVTASYTKQAGSPNAMTNTIANNYYDVKLGGKLQNGTQTVKGHVFVNGDVAGGTLNANKLTLSGIASGTINLTMPPPVTAAVKVDDPCNCSKTVNVAQIVANGAANNDNAKLGLDATLFSGPPLGGVRRLDLPCGKYYLTAINTNVPIAIVAHGRTALFVGGDIVANQPVDITLDPTAELDLFVGGTIKTQSNFSIGSRNYPALSRTYVGGAQEVTLAAGDTINGFLYDAAARVTFSSANEVFGGVFAQSFRNTSDGKIHYDRQILKSGDSCPPPTTSPDAGGGCRSCMECGNQACVNGMCGACTSSSQCCAPLICSNGMCVAPIL